MGMALFKCGHYFYDIQSYNTFNHFVFKTVPINNIEDNATNTSQQFDEEDNELQFKYATCKYCKGIISRLAKKSAIHCSKVCIETNKVVRIINVFV